MTNTFLDWLTKLAPEGETMLVLKQKPKRDEGGNVMLHPDGAIKATWPAFLPEKWQDTEQAWYANTASFVIDRFEKGRVSASASNCEYVAVMVLDDVGTPKAPKPSPLLPTWIMETSPGSYQWGYAFTDEQPTKGEFAAAIKAITEAGYGDVGATNPVRNFRLPGSVNLKPGKDGFRSCLVEFHPEREYTLTEICSALDVTPGPADGSGPKPIRLSDPGSDDVLAWLSGQGKVYSGVNQEGWCAVECPNAEAHTDGNPEGRYNPSMRAFCCYHGHCTEVGSNEFLSWVADLGGPKHAPGLRDELLAQVMDHTLSKLTPTQEFPDEAARVIAEVERKEAARLDRAEWFERYAYLEQDDAFFDLVDRRPVRRATFDALYRHVPCYSIHTTNAGKKRRIEASTFYDENRLECGARSVIGMTYAAGETVLCAHEGSVYANRWRDARPSVPEGLDASPWVRHVERLIPDAMERNHFFDVLAYKLQNPKKKINHAILFGSTNHGVGKDLTFKPFFWAIGAANVQQMKNEQLHTQWGYHLECEVLHINELRQTESADRRALENKLKPIIAAPPDMLTIERKNAHPYSILNRLLVVAATNARDAIALGTDDRRWFVVWSDATPLNTPQDPDAGKRFSEWLDSHGNQAVASWLRARDVSQFNPGATPPMTEAKMLLIGAARSMSEAWLIEQIEQRSSEFARGLVAGPWQAVCDRLQGMAPPNCRIVPPAVLHALREAGWNDLGLCHSRNFKNKRHIFAHPGYVGLKSDARDAVEVTSTSTLRVV